MELRKAIFGLVVAVAAVALAAQDASAFWGHGSWGSYGGSWGSCGSSGGSWGSGGSYGSCGSCGGLFHRWGSCGCCGGSWGGSYGSSGSSGSCGSCGGSYGSSGSSGSCGSCGSCGGEGGVSYSTSYGGNVEYARSSSPVPADIYAASNIAPPAKTKLTLHVPAEAKVTLAGVATKQAGQTREFSTDKLAAGQNWQNYTVHVEVIRDGKTIAKDKQITLTGGAQQELSFDFGGEQVAQL